MRALPLIALEAVLGFIAAYLLKRITGEHFERPTKTEQEYLGEF